MSDNHLPADGMGRRTALRLLAGATGASLAGPAAAQSAAASAAPTAGTADGNAVQVRQTGAGAIGRPLSAKLAEFRSIADNGAIGDGIVDDLRAVRSGIADYRRVLMPAGTYRLPLRDRIGLSASRDAIWRGDGPEATVLRFEAGRGEYMNCLAMAPEGGLRLEDLTIELIGFSGGVAEALIARSGLECRNVHFKGGTQPNGGRVNWTAHCIRLPEEETQEDILFEGCRFSGWSYPLHKTNAARSVQRRLTLKRCDLFENYSEAWAFNSPSGAGYDIDVLENNFRDSKGHLLRGNVLDSYIDFVGAKRFRIAGNHFSGKLNHQCVHIEENCEAGIVDGNVADIDGSFLSIMDNGVGGRSVTPTAIQISRNIARNVGPLRRPNSVGVALVADESPNSPVQSALVTENLMIGFESGYDYGCAPADGASLSRNIADNCKRGYTLFEGSSLVTDNVSRNCEFPLTALFGGVVRNHTILNCERAPETTYFALTLENLSMIVQEFAVQPNVLAYRTLFPLTPVSRLDGRLMVSIRCEAAADRVERTDHMLWDGQTLTRSAGVTNASGALTADVVAHEGSLAVAVQSSAARARMRLQLGLQGMITFTAA